MAKKFDASFEMEKMMECMPSIGVPSHEEETEDGNGVNDQKRDEAGKKPAKKQPKERFCVYLGGEVSGKIRTLSGKEGLTICDIVEAGVRMYLEAYEAKHGKIAVRKSKKGKASDLV